MNVKFHKNCENTVKILKIAWVTRCNFVKFDIHFPRLPEENFFGVKLQMTIITSL